MSESWRTHRARVAALKRHHPEDPSVADEPLRALQAARAEEQIHDTFKDPVKLAAAARLIRDALARQGLTLDDLPDDPEPLCDCGRHGG